MLEGHKNMTLNKRAYPGEKKQRNADLYKDYNDGMMIIDMVAKYRITSARIYAIINQIEKRNAVMPDVLEDLK